MRFLVRNLAPIYVALVASLMAWLYGGAQSWPLVLTVPWLMLFMAEILFVFPQPRRNESIYDARDRVWEKMRADPLVWTALGLLVLLAVPFVNNGLCATCDKALIAQGMNPDPPVRFLPFCVDRYDHFNVFLWCVTAFSCMIATKHCLTRRGKRLMLGLIAWNGAALAVLGFVQVVCGAPGPFWQTMPNGEKFKHFFSAWGYENMAGDYFTTVFCLAVGLWRWHYDEGRKQSLEISIQSGSKPRDLFWKQNLYLIPAAVCFFAALNTLSRSAIILASSAAVVFFVHTFVSFVARVSRSQRVKAVAICGLVLGVIAFCALSYTPKSLKREAKKIDSTEMLDRVTGKKEVGVNVAMSLWKQHKLFGCGGWGYRHFYYTLVDESVQKEFAKYEWIRAGKANVHNDYLQVLTEHGLVGLGAFVAIVILLLKPYFLTWRALVKSARFLPEKERPPRPMRIFALPAPAFCILTAVLATFIHGFADCPLRSAAVSTLFFVELAAIEGFMPKVELPEEHHHHHHHHHHH